MISTPGYTSPQAGIPRQKILISKTNSSLYAKNYERTLWLANHIGGKISQRKSEKHFTN